MHEPAESLEQRSTRLLDQSAIEQSQAQYLNEISAILRAQSACLGHRSRALRRRMVAIAAIAAGLAELRCPPANRRDRPTDAAL